ncbi:MAG TPA: serine/threonine-protein kinase [Candidatus Acidoferrum sp.]|nr:serine/threonine-protein kinase [Candidatus Acidoferrum sp.]
MDSDAGTTLVENGAGYEGETIAPAVATARKPPSAPSAPRRPSSAPSLSPLTSSDPIGGGRFTPGQILAERYRVVALAGRGGMGEVYRAEDLRLGQIVAMKFLPEKLSQDAAALSRFHAEVRNARQVSHPNVCRVFDIGEAESALFLTMEYVDGEDLASVVRRIGRLSPDKATEIARQICAGLAAAHERGVIHRDLKPANVMLDGAGKIRITDFGLAGIAADMRGEDARAGTPAYMAPEQLSGKEVTAKSDIYSLGLILYEILTGKRAFEASTLAELIKQRESGTITNPSTLIRDLDPLIERVILRCLETDPDKRPASALQVAAALPGGDPLAAALAAGETPSPEMVAAAGTTEGMNPRMALGLLALTIVGMVGYLFVAETTRLSNRGVLENPPEVLAARAKDVLVQLGYDEKPVDSAYSFSLAADDHVKYILEHDKTPTRWNVLAADRPSPVVFWYRQSPRQMRPEGFFSSSGDGRVTTFDPPMDAVGMVSVTVDMRGRLVHFEAVPPQRDAPLSETPVRNWSSLFTAAGLDPASFHPAAPEWAPLAWGDARAAWTGVVPGRETIPLRIEAAFYRGKPIYFDTIYPWSRPERSTPYAPSLVRKIWVTLFCVLIFAVLVGGLLVARHNLRLGRVDGRGALRLGSFVLVVMLAMWALRAHHILSFDEVDLFIIGLSWALLYAAFGALLYLALEPYVRRREPQTLISWARLMKGKFGDPLVGRDLLVGTMYGVALVLFEVSDNFIYPLLGKLPPIPNVGQTESLMGVRMAIGILLGNIAFWVLNALGIFFLIFLLRLVLRKDWLVAIAVVTVFSVGNLGGEYPMLDFVFSVLIWFSILLVLKRFGLLVLVTGLVVQNVLILFPVTAHLSRWYAAPAMTGLGFFAALAFYGFHTARAGQPIFSGAVLDN